MGFQDLGVMTQLRGAAVCALVVHIDEVQDLGELQAQPPAPQGELEPCAIAGPIDAVAALAARADDALVLVETDGAWCDRELARQFGDGPGGLGHRPEVYVNVKLYDAIIRAK